MHCRELLNKFIPDVISGYSHVCMNKTVVTNLSQLIVSNVRFVFQKNRHANTGKAKAFFKFKFLYLLKHRSSTIAKCSFDLEVYSHYQRFCTVFQLISLTVRGVDVAALMYDRRNIQLHCRKENDGQSDTACALCGRDIFFKVANHDIRGPYRRTN